MPVMFHGSWQPHACNQRHRMLRQQAIARGDFGMKWPKPQLILFISADWLIDGCTGFPVAAQEIAQAMHQPMFPEADIPVIQLSMEYSRSPAKHYALGQQLKDSRERSGANCG